MKSLQIENGGWEVRTDEAIKNDAILFVVRRPVWERIGYKAKVKAEIVRRGRELEINLVHNKILPPIIIEAIRTMADEVLRESGISKEPVLRLVASRPMQNKPFRRRA